MKLGFGIAIAALGAASLSLSPQVAGADDDPAKNVKVEAKRDGGRLSLTIKPADSWYINTDFPLKCTLKVADGGKLDKSELGKGDAKFEDSGKAGKAKSVSFSTGADKAVDGECKLVICSDSSCSSPFKIPVKSN